MDKKILTPGEIAEAIISTGVKRAHLSSKSYIILGILAGIFISFGGVANILVTQTLGNVDPGLARFVGGMVFPVGLMLVVMCGAELFTGNNLMTLALFDKKISVYQIFRNWSIVYIANLIGSLIIVFFIYYGNVLTGDAATKVVAVAESKVNLSFIEMFMRAIMCNMMVVLAVWMATAAQDVTAKIFACWFPIMLFVLCGFEHSIANMFFIPMGMMLGGNIAISGLINNLLVVTLGNIVGGGIIIPGMYYLAYIKPNREAEKAENLNLSKVK